MILLNNLYINYYVEYIYNLYAYSSYKDTQTINIKDTINYDK